MILRRYLNDEKLQSNDAVLMTSSASKNDYDLNLKWNKLSLLNAGQIKVHAKNSEGEAMCTAKLAVRGKLYLGFLLMLI